MVTTPEHVAICMDGNRRWAKIRNLPSSSGHRAGVSALKSLIAYAPTLGIKYLSVFAFSRDNWQRSGEETQYLMRLFVHGLKREIKTLMKLRIRLQFIGDRQQLSHSLQDAMKAAESQTSENDALTLIIALNYSGQWDILQAAQNAIVSGNTTLSSFESNLSLAGVPDPDLMIRTSGEKRLSNFFLWQMAYTELYFTDVYWPDFTTHAFERALNWYVTRNRRFGSNA